MMTPSSVVVGFLSSVITELLKYVPILNHNSITRALTAIVVIAIGTFVTSGTFDFTAFTSSLVFALTSYAAVVQPVAKGIGMRTQGVRY